MNKEQFNKKSKSIKRDKNFEAEFMNLLTEAWEWILLAEYDASDECVLAVCLDYSRQIHSLSKKYELCRLIDEVDNDVVLHDRFARIYQLVVNKLAENKNILKKGFEHFRNIQHIVNHKDEFEPQLEIDGKIVNIIEHLNGGLFKYVCLMDDAFSGSELEAIGFLSRNTCFLCDALYCNDFVKVHRELGRLNSFIYDC